MNYCQELWKQLNNVTNAEQQSEDALVIVNREGGEDIDRLEQSLKQLEQELDTMQEVWNNSTITLKDGRKLFGPEYQALEQLAQDNPDFELDIILSDPDKITIENDIITKLNLINTQVSDLSPLSTLTNLQALYLYGTQVSDLSPLSTLTNLQALYLHGTQVSDLSPLSTLTNLQRLYLRDTQVSNLSPLSTLTNLQRLNLRDTPIAKDKSKEAQEQIEALKGRGVNVII